MRRRRLLQAIGAAAAGSGLALPRSAKAQSAKFPDGFLWGTATSAYQVEGRGERRAESIWDAFARQPGKIKDGSNGDVACDHFHRYPEDIALIKRAGLKAYRFSISWPRVLPGGTGRVDQAGLDFYSRLTDALLKEGIEPWVCLYHWELPQVLQERGGWTNRDAAGWYAELVGRVARRLGDRVRTWLTLNEPSVHALLGHGLGQHAPGLKRQDAMLAAFHHQNLAHGQGVAALRAQGGERFKIGTALSLQPAYPSDESPESKTAAEFWDAVWNRSALDPPLLGRYPVRIARSFEPLLRPGDLAQIQQRIDFVGVNYYNPMYIKPDPGGVIGAIWGAVPDKLGRTGLGWPVDPNGLIAVLTDLREHYGNPPVYVTENGACYPDSAGPDGKVNDTQRIAFFRDHLAAAQRARAEGANLQGYFAWSLIDNFEWAEGYTAPFGIVRVDRPSLARTPKASYEWFSRVVQDNAL